VSDPICFAIDSRRWIDYWLNELNETESASLEEHLFECGACTTALARLAALGKAIRSLHKQGDVATFVPTAFVEKMKDAGMSVREYRLAPHSSVYCCVTPQDDFVVGHLEASLAGVTRLDAILEDVDNRSSHRLTDIPFNPDDGEIVLQPSIRELRPIERLTLQVQLIAVGMGNERILGIYTFNHRGPGTQS
jgi:Putative zinc-finger